MKRQSDRAAYNALLRMEFRAFLRRCFSELHPGGTFLDNWHIDAIAYHLELVRTGRISRLIINLPPRSLKSMLCSVAFPAFVLGHEPSKRMIAVSYGADLAGKLSNDFRGIVTSGWYQNLFPRCRLSRIKNTEFEIVTTQHGFRLATSVGGSLTGRGGDIVIIDDPLKPQDAYSEIRRAAANDWFYNTLLSRLDDKQRGAIIVVMQRLHPDDLTGKLLEDSDEWTILNLPAIAEHEEKIAVGENVYHFRKPGDVLHPEREPIGIIRKLHEEFGPDIFAAQYQQNPLPVDGNMIKRDWVQRYRSPPSRTPSTQVLQSYDTASKVGEQNAWSVCTTWYLIEGKYFLVDVMRGQFDYPLLKARAIEHARKHNPTKILVEDTGVGTALIPELKQAGFSAVAVKVEHSKQIRMAVQSAKFQSGQVYFPEEAPWLKELEAELFAFPASRHNDHVDSISQALAKETAQPLWTAKSLDGYVKVMEGLAFDQWLGRVTGRPW